MSERYFPFHPLGFRSNPFRALTREEWAEVAIIPPQIEEMLASDFTHVQIIGEQGIGKTSTLLALQEYFTNLGQRVRYHYLHLGEKRFRGRLHSIDVLLLDEMQRLSITQRTRLLRKIAPRDGEGIQLICSTHEDLAPIFEGQNRPLTTILLGIYEETFVRQIMERRLQFFALDKQASLRFSEPAYRFLHKTFRSDLRSLEEFLYDVFQQQSFGGEISKETLQQAMQSKPTPERE